MTSSEDEEDEDETEGGEEDEEVGVDGEAEEEEEGELLLLFSLVLNFLASSLAIFSLSPCVSSAFASSFLHCISEATCLLRYAFSFIS